MARTRVVNNTAKVKATLREAQINTLQEVASYVENELKSRYKHWAKDPDFSVSVIGETTIKVVIGAPGKYMEWGTGTRGEEGKASGQPFDIPRPRSWDWSKGPGSKPKFDYSLHQIETYRTEYRSFRTKDGKVKTIPKKVKMKEDRGRRLKADGTPKKALYIPGIGFRAVVYDHPGIKPHPIVRPLMREVRELIWEGIYNRSVAEAARKYGVKHVDRK